MPSSNKLPLAMCEDMPHVAARKYKASDLPLSSATRFAIDGLAQSFKKKGGYDDIRKRAWEKFEASVRTISSLFAPFSLKSPFSPS